MCVRAGFQIYASCAGLTRASIHFQKMDCRVEPGNDKKNHFSFVKMIVPDAANMPPTPWQTETLAP
jgi:hypothetical protein